MEFIASKEAAQMSLMLRDSGAAQCCFIINRDANCSGRHAASY
jgi:hypothetical protein